MKMKQNAFRKQFHVFLRLNYLRFAWAAIPSPCLFNFNRLQKVRNEFPRIQIQPRKHGVAREFFCINMTEAVAGGERTSTSSVHSLFILTLSVVIHSFVLLPFLFPSLILSFAASLFLFLFFSTYFLPILICQIFYFIVSFLYDNFFVFFSVSPKIPEEYFEVCQNRLPSHLCKPVIHNHSAIFYLTLYSL
jgi:hypothetical protein